MNVRSERLLPKWQASDAVVSTPQHSNTGLTTMEQKEAMPVPPPNEALLQAARRDLMLCIPEQDRADPMLFQHACRVERYAAHIGEWLRRQRRERFDELVVAAAALYHGSAWAVRYHEGQADRSDILNKPLSDVHFELSASKAAEGLAGVLEPAVLDNVCHTIRECGRRDTTLIAAHIISEACSLDHIGPLALWHIVRRHVEEGRSIEEALSTWDRQREYNFWHARIKDSFRFEEIKQVAEQRLEELDVVMAAMREHSAGLDLRDALAPKPRGTAQPTENRHPF